MFRDILSSKLVIAGLTCCVLLITGILLYRRHVVDAIRKTAAAPKATVPEKAIADIPVSPYGFGPYPELPDEM